MRPVENIGAFIKCVDACSSESSGAPSAITAAGGLDNTKVTGQTIDRVDSGNGGLARSCTIATSYLAALQATETLKLAHEVQYSADGTSWDTAVAIEAATVKATGDTGGSNERGVDEHNLDLSGQKRYFRINVTADLSASGTDTVTYHTVAALGGYDVHPG